MLNCPKCGAAWPDEYGKSETWRDAATRWRNYALELEGALEIESARSEAWSQVARERRHLLRVAWHKMTGKPPPPIDPTKDRPDADLRKIAIVVEEAAEAEEQQKIQT